MFRNYLTVAVRNLASHRLHAVINIGGLAVGLAACLLIVLFVRDELSYEDWLPNADRIVNMETSFYAPGREKMAFGGAPGPLKAAIEKDFSTDVERAVRTYSDEEPVRVGDRQFVANPLYVDPGFFEVFDLPMVTGDRAAALANNASIVLSETTARKYFGDQPPVGQTLTLSGTHVFTVVGVFRDIPRNSDMRGLESIALLDMPRYKDQPWVAERWTSVNTRVYVLLRTAAARGRVQAGMEDLIDRNVNFEIPGFTERPSIFVDFELMPVLDIHLHADKRGYENTGSFTAVLAFSGIALLILIIACINFVNLATARAMTRAREVAMRKVVGATRRQLISQHLGEAVLTAVIALVIALALVELTLTPFNSFLDKQLRLDLLGDPFLLLMMFGLVLVVGVIGGLYPAIYLSRFRPATVLKANQSSAHGSSLLRSGLVVFQFAISIALIICTATIYTQTVYARTFDVGFDHADRLVVNGLSDLPAGGGGTMKKELVGLPGVLGVAMSSDVPPLRSNNNTLLYPEPSITAEKLVIETLNVDTDFFKVYGVKPLAGRLFAPEYPGDFVPKDDAPRPKRQSIVINMAFAAKLGAKRPEDAVGKVLWEPDGDDGKALTETTVVGVVPDLHLRSVRAIVTPLLYYASRPDADIGGGLTVHVAPGRMRETRQAVEAIWNRAAPTVPARIAVIDENLAKQYDGDEQRGQIFAGFALFAILIACLGLFGLASFSAGRRTKEIGMRKVMGATVLDVVRLLVWQFSRPVLIANLIAWPVSFFVMRKWLAGFEYAIDLMSPVVLLGIFGGAAAVALGIAWLTTAGHAYKVARANPGRALRVE